MESCEKHKEVKAPHCPICLMEELETLRSLEKQYCERLGEIAQLADVVCPYVLQLSRNTGEVPSGVFVAATEIMNYVDAVRP